MKSVRASLGLVLHRKDRRQHHCGRGALGGLLPCCVTLEPPALLLASLSFTPLQFGTVTGMTSAVTFSLQIN